jgi:hypothetical protein
MAKADRHAFTEDEALDELAFTPCASDAEFLEKLRYLYSAS